MTINPSISWFHAQTNRKRLCALLFLAYTALLLYGTFKPFRFTLHPGRDGIASRRVEWVPFTNLCPKYGIFCPEDTTGLNIAIFIPVGVLGAMILARGPGAMRLTARAAAIGFGISFLIETGQYFFPDRLPATTDLLMNSLGACLGGLVAALLLSPRTVRTATDH